MTAHVLLDLGVTRFFVSLAFIKKFNDAPGTLDYSLEVEIVDDRPVSALGVRGDCVMNMFSERYSIELVPIPL